jgi:hypothetical protein
LDGLDWLILPPTEVSPKGVASSYTRFTIILPFFVCDAICYYYVFMNHKLSCLASFKDSFTRSLLYDQRTPQMHVPTAMCISNRLILVLAKSSICMNISLITLATQKKRPLTIKELSPSRSISMKAIETNELNPALRTIIKNIKK